MWNDCFHMECEGLGSEGEKTRKKKVLKGEKPDVVTLQETKKQRNIGWTISLIGQVRVSIFKFYRLGVLMENIRAMKIVTWHKRER